MNEEELTYKKLYRSYKTLLEINKKQEEIILRLEECANRQDRHIVVLFILLNISGIMNIILLLFFNFVI